VDDTAERGVESVLELLANLLRDDGHMKVIPDP
jgi:hypothetical protein